MPRKQAREVFRNGKLAVAAALIAGAVDGIGFVILLHLFTAHMSGNSVAFGVYFARREWESAFPRFFPIPVFVLGVIIGAASCELLARRGTRSVHALVLGLEGVLLLLFLIGVEWVGAGEGLPRDPAWRFYLLAALPALAMGIQSAAIRRTGSVKVRTTYITGMLTNAAEEAVECLFWLRGAARHPLAGRWLCLLRLTLRQAVFARMLLYFSIWLGYVLGAIGGVWIQQQIGVLALVPVLLGLAVLGGADLFQPLWHRESTSQPDWRP